MEDTGRLVKQKKRDDLPDECRKGLSPGTSLLTNKATTDLPK